MELKHTHLNVPVGLAINVLREKIQSPFGLYITLKAYSEGIINCTDLNYQQIREILNYESIKSVKNNLDKLIGMNWSGYNPQTGFLFIRSFIDLRNKYEWEMTKTSIFFPEYDRDIDAFLYGTVIGYFSYRQKFFKRKAGREKCRALQATYKGFYPVSVGYIAKILNISNSTASLWRARAINSGYIERIMDFDHLDIEQAELTLYREFAEDGYKTMRVRGPGEHMIIGKRNPDLIRPKNLVFRKGKKSNHIKV